VPHTYLSWPAPRAARSNRSLRSAAASVAIGVGARPPRTCRPVPRTPISRVRGERLPQAIHHRKAFRISESDLQARPIYHRKGDSIEAHLTIVFAALAVTHRIETTTGWSIKKFIHTARSLPHHNHPGRSHTIAAAAPDDLRTALAEINSASRSARLLALLQGTMRSGRLDRTRCSRPQPSAFPCGGVQAGGRTRFLAEVG
jgi:hypothetical protein